MDIETYVDLSVSGNLSSAVLEMGSRRHVESWQTVVTGTCLSPIIVLGIIGNCFSLLVWSKGRRRKTSTARYLSALAIADITVLAIPAAEFWTSYVLHVDLPTMATYLCKFYYYAAYVLPAVSAWILVAVTVERALSVWIPHRINVVCTPFTAAAVILALAVVLGLIYLPLFTGTGIVTVYMKNNNTSDGEIRSFVMCDLLPSAIIRDLIGVWLILDLCLFFLIPFIIMLFCNISILVKVLNLARKRRETLQARSQKTAANRPSKSEKMVKTVTRRVVILTIAYAVCNAPLSILNAMIISENADDMIQMNDVQIYRITFHLLMFLNNGINFLLYCMIGSGFRRDFVGMFKSGSKTSTTR